MQKDESRSYYNLEVKPIWGTGEVANLLQEHKIPGRTLIVEPGKGVNRFLRTSFDQEFARKSKLSFQAK